ncbi:MAG: hypothetical protein PHV20_05825 [Bacteroidales bacterium]|nr:hypothetical protein [Bacteroidales bacterium]
MKKSIFLVVIFSMQFSFLCAQSSESLLNFFKQKQLITQQEADSLMAIERKIEPSRTIMLVDKVKFMGYGHINYQYSDTSSLNHTYCIKRLIAIIDAKLAKNLGFQIQSNLGASAQLIELFIEWSPKQYAKLKAGQMKVPFSIENQMSLAVLENIVGSQAINNLVGGSADVLGVLGGGGRDIGVQLSGDLLHTQNRVLLDYKIGLFNGNGINNMDNNNSKDMVGMLTFSPNNSLKFSSSAYFGTANYFCKDFGDTRPSDHERNRWSVGAELNDKLIYCRTEYLHGKDASINKQGFYVLSNVHVSKAIDVIAQYDYYNKNILATNRQYTNYGLGVNWTFCRRSRFQVLYLYKDNNFAKSENSILGQVQVGF